MPYAADGATPMNMGTQCANVGVENQNTVWTVLRKYFRLAVRSVDWKYFGLGVHTSDPLLNVVKWIAYFTEVSCIHVRDVIVTSFYTQIGAIVLVYVLLILYFFLLLGWFPNTRWHFETFVIFAFLFLTGGVIMGWCYLHFLWIKPTRHLLLGIQQVCISQAFIMKSF